MELSFCGIIQSEIHCCGGLIDSSDHKNKSDRWARKGTIMMKKGVKPLTREELGACFICGFKRAGIYFLRDADGVAYDIGVPCRMANGRRVPPCTEVADSKHCPRRSSAVQNEGQGRSQAA